MKTFAEKKWGDCKNAVAYSLNFVQMCYGYDSDFWGDYYQSICPHYDDLSIQIRDFKYPRSGFSKKDYFILDTCVYGVSEKLRQDMLDFGIGINNFRPIRTKKHNTILGYQVCPQNVLPDTSFVNGFRKILLCKKCNYYSYEMENNFSDIDIMNIYNGFGYPEYINEDALKALDHIAVTNYSSSTIIISLNLYNYLIEKYPRLECCPVFLGDVRNDKEYIRLTNFK